MTTFAYDCRHRLIKRTDPHGQVTTYTYDAFNRRTSKTEEGRTTEYLWQGNKLIAETDNQQHWQTFLYEPGSHRPMATIVGSTRVNSPKVRTYWYQNDHLGTPHSLTDSQGNTVWRGQYSAYGQLTEEWTQPDDPYGHPQPKVNNPLRFQGQYEDAESGLYYNLNRYYDPGIGRYLTQDPTGLKAGLNNYQYAECNPVSYIDPLGLFTIKNKFPDETLPKDGVILPHTIENGKIKGIDGKREMDFVVTQDGRLVIGEKHHFLGNAEDVLAAGQLRLNGLGQIRRIDNLSGHYRPTLDESLNFPEALKTSGLDISGATLNGYRIPVTSDGLALQPILEIKKVLRNE
ncbi:MAG: RHS repeat domain-containing protein [Pseudomonadota bacterium]